MLPGFNKFNCAFNLCELINGFNGGGYLLEKESYSGLFAKQLNEGNYADDSQENEGIFIAYTTEGLIGHSGGDPGVTTHMFFDPKTSIGKNCVYKYVFGS